MPNAHTENFNGLPDDLFALAKACSEQGGRALLVGGCVRDRLLGRVNKDLDVEVYGIEVTRLVKLLRRFGPVNEVGRSFGVYKLIVNEREVDVSIPRRDSNIGPGHRGIEVAGDPHMSVSDASRRRDLTINALLYDPLTDELLDPSGGLSDLHQGILRPVDTDTFLEDPLRAVRAVQFAARLGFRAHSDLHRLCEQASLDELPAERIQGEWEKLLLRAQTPSVGFRLARSTDVLQRLFPEIAESNTTAYEKALDALAQGPRDHLTPGQRWALMLGVWLHEHTPAQVEATLDRLWLHRWSGYRLRERALQLIAHWRDPIDSDSDLRWLSTRCELEITLLARWSLTQESSSLSALDRARELRIAREKPKPILLGRHLTDLGYTPGPAMGRLLHAVYTQQLDGTITTLADAKAAVRALRNQKGPA